MVIRDCVWIDHAADRKSRVTHHAIHIAVVSEKFGHRFMRAVSDNPNTSRHLRIIHFKCSSSSVVWLAGFGNGGIGQLHYGLVKDPWRLDRTND